MISALFLFLLVTRDRRFPLRQRPDSVARIGCRVYAQSTARFGERHIHVLGPVLGEPDVREFLRPEIFPVVMDWATASRRGAPISTQPTTSVTVAVVVQAGKTVLCFRIALLRQGPQLG